MWNNDNDTSLPKEIPPILLLSNHKTSSNKLVDVFQVDYSDSARLYRVCRCDVLGPHIPAILRPFSPNDLILLVILVALELPSLPSFVDSLYGLEKGEWILSPYEAISGSVNNSLALPLLPYDSEVAWYLPRIIPLVICCLVLIYRLISGLRHAQTEEVLVIRGLGMQLTVYNIFGGIVSQRYVDLKLIRALIIHDAYFRCQAIFFLSAIVENDGDLLVLFEETLPRLEVLQPLLRGLRYILYEEPEEGATLAELACRLDDGGDGDDSDVADHEELHPLSLSLSSTASLSSLAGGVTTKAMESENPLVQENEIGR